MLCWILTLLGIPSAIWLVCYLVSVVMFATSQPQDLKKKYKAKWAIVTGGGSGIGRALVQLLATQGLNVVIVSLDDNFLEETFTAVCKNFPNQEFRKVGVVFAPGVNYLEQIAKQTEDIDVQIVFNNAGYIVTGFYEQVPVAKQLANLECNAVAAAGVSHIFIQRMIQKKLKGCVVFTSSVAGYIPSPFSSIYGATKAFLSQFAACLAVECKNNGIDVCAVHPSPVNSNFYTNTHKLDMLEMAKKQAVTPQSMASDMLKAVGRFTFVDIGSMAICTRIFVNIIPYNTLAGIFTLAAPFLPDFKKHNKDRVKQN